MLRTGDNTGITRRLRDVLGLRILSYGGYRCRHEDSRRWKALRNDKAMGQMDKQNHCGIRIKFYEHIWLCISTISE